MQCLSYKAIKVEWIMGLFGKKERKRQDAAIQDKTEEQTSEMLADALFAYLQKEGFFPERETSEDPSSRRVLLYFKFQGLNVTMEIPDNDYLRLVVVFEVDPESADYFNLMMAASQTMYEMRAVKVVLGVKWIQFSVETFVASAETFTPFLMRYLEILSDAVGRHRAAYSRFLEEKEREQEKERNASAGGSPEDPMEKLLQDAVNAQLDNPVKS